MFNVFFLLPRTLLSLELNTSLDVSKDNHLHFFKQHNQSTMLQLCQIKRIFACTIVDDFAFPYRTINSIHLVSNPSIHAINSHIIILLGEISAKQNRVESFWHGGSGHRYLHKKT